MIQANYPGTEKVQETQLNNCVCVWGGGELKEKMEI